MTDEPSPRPWRITHPGEIEDANGKPLYNLRDCIGGGVDEANAALIVDAVNGMPIMEQELRAATVFERNATRACTEYREERDRLRKLLEDISELAAAMTSEEDEANAFAILDICAKALEGSANG